MRNVTVLSKNALGSMNRKSNRPEEVLSRIMRKNEDFGAVLKSEGTCLCEYDGVHEINYDRQGFKGIELRQENIEIRRKLFGRSKTSRTM